MSFIPVLLFSFGACSSIAVIHSRKETWCTSKSLALYSSLFFVVNWILIIALGFRPFTLSDKIIYYGIGMLSVFDFKPRDFQ